MQRRLFLKEKSLRDSCSSIDVINADLFSITCILQCRNSYVLRNGTKPTNTLVWEYRQYLNSSTRTRSFYHLIKTVQIELHSTMLDIFNGSKKELTYANGAIFE